MPVTFETPHRIEDLYRRAIGNYVHSAFRPLQPGQNLFEWIADVTEYSLRPEAVERATNTAVGMARMVNAANARSWREAARRSTRSQLFYRMLQRELAGVVGQKLNGIVQANAGLIRSIPSDVATQLTREIAAAQQSVARSDTIAKMMRMRFPELTRSRISLVARTETAKASTALTEARCDELGIPAYIWETSQDSRVRKSHRNMNGVIVFWGDPPSPEALLHERSTLGHYHSGNCPNCRCGQTVILSLDDVSWPRRCYTSGRIIRVTRHQFAQLSGMQIAA